MKFARELLIVLAIFLIFYIGSHPRSLVAERPNIVASAQLQNILDKIIKVSDKSNRAPQAKAYINKSSDLVTAITWQDRSIVFHAGLMKFVKNEDELALIMGHELGHILNGDLGFLKAIFPDAEKQDEIDADVLGTILMHRAGYDCDKAKEVWVRFQKAFGDRESKTHPKPSYRYNKVNNVCQIQKLRHP